MRGYRRRPTSSRLEVMLPFRVFARLQGCGLIGLSAPGSTLALALRLAHPVLPRCLYPGTRLPGLSSHGVTPSFTVRLSVSAPGLSAEGTSLGVLVPYSALGRRKPRPLQPKPVEALSRGCLENPPTIPTADYGAALGFLNLSATCFSSHPPAIFRQVALMGFALQGIHPPTQTRMTRRHRHALLTFFLEAGPSLPRTETLPGALGGA